MSFEETLFDAPQKEKKDLSNLLGMEGVKKDISQYKKMAENGDKRGMFLLARCYENGDGVAKNMAEACYWYEQCDDAMALCALGSIYLKDGNKELAEEYWLHAVDAANDMTGGYRAIACIDLVVQFYLSTDILKADAYLRKALEIGLPEESQYQQLVHQVAGTLGKLMDKQKNIEKAIDWYKYFLADEEDEQIRKFLQLDYVLALGGSYGEELQKEALSVVEPEAEKGNELFIKQMFVYYFKHPENEEKYLYWTKKAADQGIELAQYRMVVEYLGPDYSGKAQKDIEKSKKYFGMCENWIKNGKDGEKLYNYYKSVYEKEAKALIFAKYPEKHLTNELAVELLKKIKASGSHVLRIPDGYTHVDGSTFWRRDNKVVTTIEEIIFPDSMMYIAPQAFYGFINLIKITLPKDLKELGSQAFMRSYVGLFDRWVRPKKEIERLVIPAKTYIWAGSIWTDGIAGFGEMYGIHELIFEEGRKEINWLMFDKNQVDYMYIPDSVVSMSNGYEVGSRKLKIGKLSLPAHLKEQYQTTVERARIVKEVVFR